MFTGIVRAMGTVQSLRRHGRGCKLAVGLSALDAEVGRGDSVAVNGACLTVADGRDEVAVFDVSPETAARCLIGEWAAGDRVNLEPALTLQTPLGGHLVTGHIDGVGAVIERADDGNFARLCIETGRDLGSLLARKGSVAVDGVSLTVNTVGDLADPGGDGDHGGDGDPADPGEITRFDVMVVPHTLAATTLGALRPGARVHLEADVLARYAARLLDRGGANENPGAAR